mgnify:CR=1 FL=1|tara:strand:- start:345 stop:497 length:153 start_codon:yes stop_codon:yes gene_type:complete
MFLGIFLFTTFWYILKKRVEVKKNNTLKISHSSKELLEGLIDKYESVKNM